MSMICELFVVPGDLVKELIATPDSIHDTLETLDEAGEGVSLEKTWHGLHFVLTGTSWEGSPPLDFLAHGGTEIGDEDVGYGPARTLNPSEVQSLHSALNQFTDEQFVANFDLKKLADAEVYPDIWDEEIEELLEEYEQQFEAMKEQVKKAAETHQGLMVVIR